VTTKSAPITSSTMPATEACVLAASTLIADISATPIVSAPAVAAVRRGLRRVLPRARRPTTPRKGLPIAAAAGRASSGAVASTPMSTHSAPTPAMIAALVVPYSASCGDITASPTPAPSRNPPITVRRPRPRVRGCSSRSAAIGGMTLARRAGRMALASVMTRPTVSATMIVRGWNTSAAEGKGAPAAWNSNCSPRATPAPTTIPSRLATRATMTASARMERNTWPRDAPIARSNASSRVRWATSMLNVL
jgi:hypothetical protein